jgi:hypothetical protein
MTPEQIAIHNAAIEEAANALEALLAKNVHVAEEYYRLRERIRALRA